METFVITKVYSAVPSETGAEQDTSSERIGDVQEDISPKLENGEVISSESDSSENGTTSFTQSPVITENAYRDPNISSTITQDRVSDTSIYVADVYVFSTKYLKTSFAQNSNGKNITEKTPEMAENNNTVSAIIGDYYANRPKAMFCEMACFTVTRLQLIRRTW